MKYNYNEYNNDIIIMMKWNISKKINNEIMINKWI